MSKSMIVINIILLVMFLFFMNRSVKLKRENRILDAIYELVFSIVALILILMSA